LLITTKEEADLTMVTRVYPVADLVQYRDKEGPFQNYLPLMEVIQKTVHPNSWREEGTGEGTVAPFLGSGGLVISQTEEVHQGVAAVLKALRAAREVQGLKGALPGSRPEKEPAPQPAGVMPVVGSNKAGGGFF
jgi:hypothetical protein